MKIWASNYDETPSRFSRLPSVLHSGKPPQSRRNRKELLGIRDTWEATGVFSSLKWYKNGIAVYVYIYIFVFFISIFNLVGGFNPS